MSRTPVREALYALEQAGLVQIRPRRGAVVFAGGMAELRQLFELREALDGMAARLAAARIVAGERRDSVRSSNSTNVLSAPKTPKVMLPATQPSTSWSGGRVATRCP